LSARVRTRAALCLALALANSGPAAADSRAYHWLDEQGNVHITATPPPDGARPVPPPAPPPALPTPPVPAAPTGAPPAAAEPEPDPCAQHAKEVSAWLAASRKVTGLEARIEEIEANPIQASTTESCPRDSPCFTEMYSRDQALRRANDDLAAAEAEVSDLEDAAHRAGVPDRCLVDPSE